MVVWSASSYPRFDISALTQNCGWAPSIDVRNTESTAPHPAFCRLRTQSVRPVKQHEPRCCVGDRALWAQQSLISHCSTSLSPFFVHFLFLQPDIKPSWISEALIPTLFLPGVVQTVSLDCGAVEHTTLFSNDDDSISAIGSTWFGSKADKNERQKRLKCRIIQRSYQPLHLHVPPLS